MSNASDPALPASRLNIPNALSASRFLFAAIFLAAFLAQDARSTWMLVAFVASGLSIVSDWADGFLARKMGIGSDFGKLFDPLADAAFFVVAFLTLGFTGVIFWWLAIPFVARELIQHLYIRPKAMRLGIALGAKWIGKIKTGVQSLVVLGICLGEWLIAEDAVAIEPMRLSASIGAGLAAALSVASIIPYFKTLASLAPNDNETA